MEQSGRHILSGILSLSLAVSAFTGVTFMRKADAAEQVTVQGHALNNPVIVKDSSMKAGQKVTWGCVVFGTYPQTEVKAGDGEYEALQSAEDWDSNGDAVVNGTRYRRMRKDDATYAYDNPSELEDHYDWEDDTTYHYFRHEPVKWRVLKTDGTTAMLLSDIALDDRQYNTANKSVTWETSTIRSWLNGYGTDANQEGISFVSSNFIDSAFTGQEKQAILDTDVINNDNIERGTEGGNNTTDKLFLLSESEVYTDSAVTYGFTIGKYDDEARMCKSSDYAKAMGAYIESVCDDSWWYLIGNCFWCLRSPGIDSDYAVSVASNSVVFSHGDSVDYDDGGIRAALNLNLSESNLYTYAGTVCSDEAGKPPISQPDTNTPKVTYSNETVSVKDDKEAYSFFTTSKVSRTVSKIGTVKTTIPAANKWEVTNGGTVDVSPYPGGKTLYFAKSTTPAYDDIITVVVPAQPKFT